MATTRMTANDKDAVSLSTVLSRIPIQSPPLPEELVLTLLTALITPHKDSRDHHLLITSTEATSTAQYIRDVTRHRYIY
jgi:hypothetical protein